MSEHADSILKPGHSEPPSERASSHAANPRGVVSMRNTDVYAPKSQLALRFLTDSG